MTNKQTPRLCSFEPSYVRCGVSRHYMLLVVGFGFIKGDEEEIKWRWRNRRGRKRGRWGWRWRIGSRKSKPKRESIAAAKPRLHCTASVQASKVSFLFCFSISKTRRWGQCCTEPRQSAMFLPHLSKNRAAVRASFLLRAQAKHASPWITGKGRAPGNKYIHSRGQQQRKIKSESET